MSRIDADGDADTEVCKVCSQQNEAKVPCELGSANVDSNSENDQNKQHRRKPRPEERMSDGQAAWSHGRGRSGDEQRVKNVCSDDVANGQITVSFTSCLDGSYKFGQRCSEGNQRGGDDRFGDVQPS